MIDKIYLIGYRATGKSTIGRELASRLDFSFLDTDSLVRKKYNCSIEEIVQSKGWQVFREYEAEALQASAGASRVVVATGGGAILHRTFWEHPQENTLVVWLTADLSVLAARLGGVEAGSSERPTLTGKAIDKEIAEVLAVRTPLYQASADFKVDTGQVGIQAAVDSIASRFHSLAGE